MVRTVTRIDIFVIAAMTIAANGFPLLAPPVRAQTQAVNFAPDFDQDVRPILSENCLVCHGPDEAVRMADLRLDNAESLASVIVPGDAESSLLLERLTASEVMDRMPRVSSGLAPSQDDIETIRSWIDQGARWRPQWAFVPPVRAETPSVADSAWVRNPIDAFVRARLDREGLEPAGQADRPTLIRRLSYDLTGLPPTPTEVEAFLVDDSDDAYEKVVDRLLPRRATVSAWPCAGWIWRAMPTRTGITSTATATCGRGAIW